MGIFSKFNPFKSQKKQDIWVVFEVTRFKRHGYFVDLAAADGISMNNTFCLEKLFAWDGLCIEPNPYFYSKLEKNRKCQKKSVAVSDKSESVNFRIDNGYLGGIVAEDTDNSQRIRGEQLESAEIISIQTETLTSILDECRAPRNIDYLSLDVEGSEERVLRGLDFDRYSFDCMTIERPTPEVNRLLFDNNYVFVKNYRFDSFYVHKSLLSKRDIKCEPFEQLAAKDW